MIGWIMPAGEEWLVSGFDNAAVRDRFSSLGGDFVFLDAPRRHADP